MPELFKPPTETHSDRQQYGLATTTQSKPITHGSCPYCHLQWEIARLCERSATAIEQKRLSYIKRSWVERRQKYAGDVMYLSLTEIPRRLVRRFQIDIQDSPTDGCEVRRRWVQRSLLTLGGEGSKWPVKMGCDEGTKEGCFGGR